MGGLTGGLFNSAPKATNDAYTVTEDTPLVVATGAGVLKNDTDANGDPLTATVVGGPTHGALTLNPDGSFTYTPAANYSGSDSFTYRARDGRADSNTATVNLSVTAVNDPPTSNNDSYAATEDTALNVTQAAGVLKNDTESRATH